MEVSTTTDNDGQSGIDMGGVKMAGKCTYVYQL
jgi:hypothetical protein